MRIASDVRMRSIAGEAAWPHQPLLGKGSAKSRFFTIQRTPRSQVSSVLPRMSTWPARTLLPELASLTSTTKLRIRFDVFCTMPLTARSAPASRARSSTQPLHFDKGDLSCICAARDVRSTTCNCPESARSRRSSALASVDPGGLVGAFAALGFLARVDELEIEDRGPQGLRRAGCPATACSEEQDKAKSGRYHRPSELATPSCSDPGRFD